MKREWLLLEGQVVRAKPGHIFEIREVPVVNRMSDEDLRNVGRPTRNGVKT